MNNNLLKGTFNFRDLGGYTNKSGKRVVEGKIFRSDAMNQLTRNDVAYLNQIGLKSIIDFRQYSEIKAAKNIEIPGTKTYNFSPIAPIAELSTGNIQNDREKVDYLIKLSKDKQVWEKFTCNQNKMGKQMLDMAFDEYSVNQFKKVFDLMLDTEKIPLVFHCKGGKDRTGLMALLFLMALQVDKKVIITDYLKTKENMKDRNITRMKEYEHYTDNKLVLDFLSSLMDTREEYIKIVFDEIDQNYNSYEDYLIEVVGLSQEDLYKLRDIYLLE